MILALQGMSEPPSETRRDFYLPLRQNVRRRVVAIMNRLLPLCPRTSRASNSYSSVDSAPPTTRADARKMNGDPELRSVMKVSSPSVVSNEVCRQNRQRHAEHRG